MHKPNKISSRLIHTSDGDRFGRLSEVTDGPRYSVWQTTEKTFGLLVRASEVAVVAEHASGIKRPSAEERFGVCKLGYSRTDG